MPVLTDFRQRGKHVQGEEKEVTGWAGRRRPSANSWLVHLLGAEADGVCDDNDDAAFGARSQQDEWQYRSQRHGRAEKAKRKR